MNTKDTLHDWIATSPTYQKYDDLFFILLEAQNNNNYDFSTYKKIYNILFKGLRDKEHNYISSANYNSYGVNNYQHNKDMASDIISCIDIITSKYSTRLLNSAEDLYLLEKHGGKYILEKNNISLNTKGFLNYKLKKLYISNNNTVPNQEKLHTFIETVREMTKIADTDIVLQYKNNNITYFCTAIDLGFQPSKEEVLTMFQTTWNHLDKNSLKLHFFCEYFAKTNVFIHSLAPAKNIEKLLKGFFKNYFTENPEPTNTQFRNLMSYNDKLSIILNHPSFLYSNLQKHMIRDHAKELLGKTNINEEETQVVLDSMNENKQVKTKRMKI